VNVIKSHLPALLPLLAHHILHVSRIRVKSHLLAVLSLLGAHHILHIGRIRVKSHLLALLGAHPILHISRIKVKSHLPSADIIAIIRSSPYSPRWQDKG